MSNYNTSLQSNNNDLQTIINTINGLPKQTYNNVDDLLTRTISNYTNTRVSVIGDYAFYDCNTLTSVNFPSVTTIGDYAFYSCNTLTSVDFPLATTMGMSAFYYCTKLTSVSFPMATSIGSYAFYGCYSLKSLYLTGSSFCTLANSNAFAQTPIGGYSTSDGTYGSIYVPASLLTSYKTATNWTYFSSRFVGV